MNLGGVEVEGGFKIVSSSGFSVCQSGGDSTSAFLLFLSPKSSGIDESQWMGEYGVLFIIDWHYFFSH